MKITIGIPAYNEEENIGEVITKLKEITDSIIVCDDGSTDLTRQISEKLGVTVIQHEKNMGYGAAINSIFKKSVEIESDVLVTFDADGQHRIEDVEKILEPILPISKTDVFESINGLSKTHEKIFSGNLTESNISLKLAHFIKNIVCIYYPAGLQAAAIRYKNSLQENTKIHAMTEDIIESCHNGIVSWEKKSGVTPVLIQGKDDYSKTTERWRILEEFFESKKIDFFSVKSLDGSILSKITNLIYLLDYSTIYAAVLNKINPSPVESIDFIKSRL